MPLHIEMPLDPPARTPEQERANQIHYALEEEVQRLCRLQNELEEVTVLFKSLRTLPFDLQKPVLLSYADRIEKTKETIGDLGNRLADLGYSS